MKWVTMWRLNRDSDSPERVRILPIHDSSFVLVEGEEHTSYKGGFFKSPADAFIAAYADVERTERYARDTRARLDRAKERFERMMKS